MSKLLNPLKKRRVREWESSQKGNKTDHSTDHQTDHYTADSSSAEEESMEEETEKSSSGCYEVHDEISLFRDEILPVSAINFVFFSYTVFTLLLRASVALIQSPNTALRS